MMPGFKRPTCWALLILLVLGVHVPLRLQAARNSWHGDKRSRDAAEVIGLLSNTPGPVACEDLSLCYRAGKGFELDFFLLGQKLSAGSIAPLVLQSRLQARYYAAIQTVANDGSSFRLPAYINTMIADYYKIVRTGPEGAVLMPRGTRN